MQDPYQILHVSKNASVEEIKASYRALARKYHPDVNQSPEAEVHFQQISEAYALLSDKSRRRMYDLFGNADPSNTPIETQIVDAVEKAKNRVRDFLGFHENGPKRGLDKRETLQVDIADVWNGGEKEIDVLQEGVSKKIKVTIPRSATEKTLLRLRGYGKPGSGGAPDGDLLLSLQFTPNREYKRQKYDLYVRGRVPLAIAQEGGHIDIDLPDSSKLRVTVPAGISGGTALRVPNYGFYAESGARGDLYVVTQIQLTR